MNMKKTRRDFIKSAGALTAGAFFIPNLIGSSPANKLNIAVIGVGGQGAANWGRVINQKDPAWNENVVLLSLDGSWHLDRRIPDHQGSGDGYGEA
jgi:hypothetical protein